MAKKGKFRTESMGKDEMPKAKLNKASLKRASTLFQYIGRNKWKFGLGMFFLAGTGATALIFPKLMGELMGLLGETSNEDQLLNAANTVGLQMLALFGMQAVFSFFRVYLFTQVSEQMLAGLRYDTFSHLARLPMGYFSKHQAAELNSRISADIEQIGGTFTTNLAEFFRQFIIIIGGVIILGITSWRLALVMLGIVPVLAIITVVFGRWIRKLSRGYQDKVAESNIVVGEALMGIANVKSFTNEAYESKRYSDKVKEVAALGLKGGVARGGFFSFIIFCLLGSIIFIVWYGIKLKISGEIPAAEMMSFMFYTIFISASIGGIAEQYGQIQKAVGATDRVLDIMNIAVEPVSTVDPRERGLMKLEGKVEFKNVGFSYPTRTDFTVLRDISFTASKGQTIALVGHSGSGKSTIAQLLLRFYDPDQGEIFFDGKSAKDFNLTELRENMAIVPQDVLLFGGTITENIAYGKPGATHEEIVDAARQANALNFIESFPDKFETKVGDRGIQLSGGQRQRIAIARAVLKNPGILILDEATSSLDSESERVVQDALEKLMVGRTSFVIAHRLSTIRHADKIVVIDKGEVVETGTHDELMVRENGVYRTLNNLQFQFTSSSAAEI